MADKLKQSAETSRTLSSAERGTKRDESLKASSAKRCSLMQTVAKEEDASRFKLLGLLKMSKKMLESMDASMFLARDMHDLSSDESAVATPAQQAPADASPASFLQISEHRSISTPLSFMQEGSLTSAAAAGPFDDVTQMINGLIVSMRSQANAEANQEQFCMESKAKNRKAKTDVTNSIDVKTSEIHWAETAAARLDDEIAFLESEASRLTAFANNAKTELSEEQKRRSKEDSDRKVTREIISKALVVLSELCDLSLLQAEEAPKSLSFLQVTDSQVTGVRRTQCSDAAKMLEEATGLIADIDSANTANLDKISTQLNGEKDEATSAASTRASDILSSKSARARRGDELAAAVDELSAAKKDLALVEQAISELATNCGPKQVSHEDQMAQRKDEIDALKNALSVLEGESVPVA